ncbi:uncharacterized protein LOC110067646 [Orbicella faveolata]|uniref:uncharacterized protein LOC110067646 n=1 Tax=Orbicella faveolata TaxID=48498 RepID=UPI0009E544A2|nr:uncharacterized protein LOC110067646 [Orbicella faveolata]XP_020630656.1 uncharacterized protein LOC110067646 [Orbicella faveolata]XP_020630657.1 uncharacterized protein LOC110067646 [Orbicella faveolata]
MIKMIILQIALYLAAFNAPCLHASGYSSEQCSQKNGDCDENGSILVKATESNNKDSGSISKIEEELNDLRSKLADSPESQQKLDEVTDWVKKQKDKNKGRTDKKPFEEIDKVLKTTVNSIEKFKTKDHLQITTGVLDIVSSFTNLVDVGKPYGFVIRSLWAGVSRLLTESKPNEPNVVDQVAKVVHDEMAHFNRRLQDQKYNGLKRRVSDQILQFRRMKPGEKLDDPNLWNDYVQFLGELAIRFEYPVPFKYEYSQLTEDPDVADFVTAVVTYSEAHSCFMALLFVAKAVYTDFGIAHENDVATVDRKMDCQINDAKEKLSFLSEDRFLTFRGKLDGGKLTKIVALSRSIRGRSLVETVRHSLGLSPMHQLSTVESSARKVDKQSVKLKSVQICNWFLLQYGGIRFSIQFINGADFPMKIFSGEVGWSQGNQLKFVQTVQPSGRHHIGLPFSFSTAGFLILDVNNVLGSDVAMEPPPEYTRVIEFAVSNVFFDTKISMQDKTDAGFSRGLVTLNERSEDAVTLFFSEGGKYYIAKAEIFVCWPDRIWRFVVQDFDPEAVRD